MTSEAQFSKGERTRQQIEEAAYSLFLKQGFHATSMRQIAQACGLAVGGIYNHFACKEEIFKAILAHRHPYRQILPVVSGIPAGTTEEFVRRGGEALIRELEQTPDFLKLMFIEMVEFSGQNVPSLFEKVVPELLPLFQRFVGSPGMLRDIPAPVMVRAFIGLFFSFYITQYLMGDLMPAGMSDKSFDYFVDIYLHGILEPKPAESTEA